MKIAIPYQARIEALTKTKLEHNQAKIARDGYHDIDDHGKIYWPDPIPFTPQSNHPSGGCYGIRCIGENFHAWLNAHPVYIHPMSALAGAWAGFLRGVGGWKPEDRPTHLAPLHKQYNLAQNGIGAMNHLGPDMKIGLTLGWGGILKKIRHYRALNAPSDTAFYDGEEALVLGVQDWIRRHVTKARAMAAAEPNPVIRENLLTIAAMNEWLVEGPPRTLREACQFLAWFQSIDRMWAAGGALGQLDELLRPFYEREKGEVGRVKDPAYRTEGSCHAERSEASRSFGCAQDDNRGGKGEGRSVKQPCHSERSEESVRYDEFVIWCIASLLFNDTHYSQIGGQGPDGRDLTSRMSFLILAAAHRLQIPYNIALRVHDDMDPKLLRQAIAYHIEDSTGVSFSCSKGLNEGYTKNGVPIQLARMRAKVGCNWTALPGIEYPLQDVTRQCMVTPFLLAFDEVVALPPAARTMEALWERTMHHLGISVDVMKEGFDWHMAHHAENTAEIVLNLFCHGPIERGLDASNGGVDLYNLTVDGVGLATVADSFAAIEQRVVQEQRLTWEALATHLKNDFTDADGEAVRLMLKNIPRFGSGNSRADAWAKRISDAYVQLYDTPTPRGYNVIPGLFSHGDVVAIGKRIGATPNGRHAGAPISHSSEPDPGFMPGGGGGTPTAKANAVAAVQPGRGNSAPLQLDIDRSLLQGDNGSEQTDLVDTVEALIRTHNAQGGTLVNLNIISKAQILEAHADPSKYPDLMVRVTGYSAYFHSLSPEYRQQVVDRILG